MGIDAWLETEQGEPLDKLLDERSLLSSLIQRGGLDSTVCLRFLDPWGDATFNHLQVPSLIAELRAARERADAATREHLDGLVALADRVEERPHLYLKFCGD